MALTITVGGVSLGARVEVKSLRIEQQVSRKGDIARLKLVDVGNTLTIARYAAVQVTDDASNTLFKGWVTRITSSVPDINTRVFDLTCQDATVFLAGRTGTKTYSNAYLTDIARDLVLNASPSVGITATNTATGQGPLLATFKVNHISLADALNKLAKLATSATQAVWDWYIDYGQDLHFYLASAAPLASITLSDQGPFTTSGWYEYERASFTWQDDDTQLGTQVTVHGGSYLSNSYVQTVVGNGSQTSWPLDYPPDVQLGGTPVVAVGGVGQTVALDQQQTPTTQWLVGRGASPSGWVAKLGTAAAPTNGTVVTLTYKYDVPVLVRASSAQQITALASLPNTGVFERFVSDTSLVTRTGAQSRATAEIAQYGATYQSAHAEIADVASGAGGIGTLAAGQRVRVVNGQLGKDAYLQVVKCQIVGTSGQFWRYVIELQG